MLFPPNSLGKRDIWPLTIVKRPLLVRSLSLKGRTVRCGLAYLSATLLVITLPPSPPTTFLLPVTLLSVIIDPAPATLRVIPHITNRPTGTLIPVNNRSTALDGRDAPVESPVPAPFRRTTLRMPRLAFRDLIRGLEASRGCGYIRLAGRQLFLCSKARYEYELCTRYNMLQV